jgi:hypothetical protein
VRHVRRTLSSIATIDADLLGQRLSQLAPSMASALTTNGYWTNDTENDTMNKNKNTENDDTAAIQIIHPVVDTTTVVAMRQQSMALREAGRFEQSWSESIVNGKATRFDKEGVFACEPDGSDYETAPDLLTYMSVVINQLPLLLNEAVLLNQTETTTQTSTKQQPPPPPPPLQLSNQSFNAKLAVTSAGGSVYPLHVDNTLGVTGSVSDDTRKLTCILYLNPDYTNKKDQQGQLRLLVPPESTIVDLDPVGGRMVLFWSDEIPHQVLPCAPNMPAGGEFDRYALTIWIPTTDPRNIHSCDSKFASLRVAAFE